MSKYNYQIQIGSDPEMVLTKNNVPVSAIPVILRDKDNRIDLGDNTNYFYDNVLLEGNVKPAFSAEELKINISYLYKHIYQALAEGYDIKTQASATYAEHECLHPDAVQAGCSEEYCAHEVDLCVPPDFVGGFRSAGGHVHLGRSDFENPSDDFLIDDFSKMDVIKAMDVFVGLPSVLMDSSQPSKDRKKLYGQAGRHRPTEYGVEYRTLSNFWLSSPELVNLVYVLSMHAVDFVRENGVPEVDFDKIREAINTNNEILAKELCNLYIPENLLVQISEFVNWNKFDIRSNWNI